MCMRLDDVQVHLFLSTTFIWDYIQFRDKLEFHCEFALTDTTDTLYETEPLHAGIKTHDAEV